MSDRIQIVDQEDKLICCKSRDEIDYEKDIYRSTALWVTNSKGEILIAQRTLNKDKDPGKWGPSVAGTVDEGETYETNVYKEAEEEIGLAGYVFKEAKKERLHAPRHQFVQWYCATVDKPIDYFTLQEDEVEKLEWISGDQLFKDVSGNPDKYVEAMKEALEFLENKE